MKRIVIPFLLVLALISNLFIVPATVSAAATAISVPPDWQLIGSEDFSGASADTLASAFVSSSSKSLITGSWTDTSTYTKKPTILAASGELALYAKTGGSASLKGTLATPIDLTVDADYYLMFDSTAPSWNSNGTSVGFGFNDTVALKYKYWDFGTYQNNSIQIVKATTSNTSDNSYNSPVARTYNWGTMQKILVQVSSRTSKLDSIKIRYFNNESEELPSCTPKFWDVEHQVDLTGIARFEDFRINGSNNAGNENSVKFDNISIYKAAPMSSYTTTGTVYGTATKYMVGDAVAPPSRIPTTIAGSVVDLTSTITYDTIPQTNAAGVDQSIISQGWYDYSQDPPVLLSDTNSYNVNSSMIGKLLKAVIVVQAGDVQSTYVPYTGYVRAAYDNTNLNAILYQSTTKLDAKLAANWAKATKLDFTVSISRNHSGNSAFSGSVAMLVGQYSSDGMLKSFIKVPATTKLGGMTSGGVQAVTVSVPITQAPVNYASGDTFKAFVWMSNQDTNYSAGVGGFAYDLILPLPFNNNCYTRVNSVIVP